MQTAEKSYFEKVFSYFEMLKMTFTPNYLAFLLMRVTGIGIAIYLFLHIWSIGHVRHSEDAFNSTMGAYNTPIFWVMEYLLLLAVMYHMMNGLRLIVADFFELTEKQSVMLWIAGLVIVAVGAVCAPMFLRGLFTL